MTAEITRDPETDTLRAACPECDWTLETKWTDTPLHRRLISAVLVKHARAAHRGPAA